MDTDGHIKIAGNCAGEYVIDQQLPDGRLVIRAETKDSPSEAKATDAAALQEELVAQEHARVDAEVEHVRVPTQESRDK
jgi:hypothetical protein